MVRTVQLKIKDLAGHTILAGAEPGRQLFSKLVAAVGVDRTPGVVFLDYRGVRVATSSFLRESTLGFRDFVAATLSDKYVAVANAGAPVLEELMFLLAQRSDALWACDIDAKGRVTDPRIVGRLDDVYELTFRRVSELGSASAPELAALQEDGEAIGATAWNNRLQALASRGILAERRAGKTKIFSTVLEARHGG